MICPASQRLSARQASPGLTRVAAILVNIVPYHHARWEAFAENANRKCQVVELTNRDTFRVLEYAAEATYRRATLFPGDDMQRISAGDIKCAMTAALDDFLPDVICVSGYGLRVSLAALQWAARRQVPVVVLSESNEFDEPRSPIKEFAKKRLVGLYSAGLAGGTPQAEYLVKLGLATEDVYLGYDVVDNEYFKRAMASARLKAPEIKARFGLPEKYFLACSRFGEKKNIPRLVEAYARYRAVCAQRHAPSAKRQAPWDLVLLGDGEKRPEIEATISGFGVAGSVHLAGEKTYGEIPAYYALAGGFVHASTTEQWGLVVNEAMASGLPVLVSNRCGCAADLVLEGANGFSFDPYNVDQLAQLMFRLSTLNSQLSTMGAASQRIIADWGPERFATGLNAAVTKALDVGPKLANAFDRVLLNALLLV